jgi:hypothetical protein
MQAEPRTATDAVRSHLDARQRHLQRILDSYGILTRSNLRELAGADHWKTPFDLVVNRAIRAKRIRPLGADLLESAHERDAEPGRGPRSG